MTGHFKPSATQTAIRLIKLMQLIPRRSANSRRRIGVAELEEKLVEHGFQISRRTLQRDLQTLGKAFPDLHNDGQKDALGWYWSEEALLESIPAMDYSMAFSFKMLDKLLSPRMPALIKRLQPYLEAADKVLPFEQQQQTERIYVISRSMPLKPVALDPSVVDIIERALLEQQCIRAHYRRRDDEVAEYLLNPLGLVLRNEVSYLVATAWDYQDPRHYALHRFVPDTVELLQQTAQSPEGFSLQQYVNEGGFQYLRSQATLKLKLRMDKDTAKHLQETPLSDDQKIITPRSGASNEVKIHASVPDTEQLRWWLLGLGNKVVVEAPKRLRDEISQTLEQALAGY